MTISDLDTTKGNKGTAPNKLVIEHRYATINKETESLLSPSDKIVFAPHEDFEYKAPLEDFQKSRQSSS